jgi:hypothetical protein
MAKICKKHPKYKAVRVPRVYCLDCWRAYLRTHGDSGLIKLLDLAYGDKNVNR